MGKLYLIQLDGRIYSCRYCHSHLANCDELVSKYFHCRHGKAYLFKTVVNVSVGPQEDRMMTTGLHTVADIYCNCCQQIVGWKYEVAHEVSQKYKEGKFILERAKVVDGDGAGTDYYLGSHPVGSDAEDI
uniref:Protein yippee-like n=1 Tax=Apopellia endiviifolia (species B) TaxID=119729 RepID=A0A6B7NT14_9MARC|nr:Yippee-like protein [Apopellia endiviifolia (species B)]